MKLKNILLITLLSISPSAFAEDKVKPVEQVLVTKVPTFDEIVVSFLDKSAKLGEKIGDAATTLSDFAVKEIPLVIQEYLNWHWAVSFIWCMMCLSITVISLLVFKYFVWNNRNQEWSTQINSYRSDFTVAGVNVLIGTIVSIALFIISLSVACNNLDWAKISIAPRVYLIDQFSQVIKK